jgi:hypothetical protein
MGKRTGKPRGRPPGSKTRMVSRLVSIVKVPKEEEVKGRPGGIVVNVEATPLEVMLDNMRWARETAAVEAQVVFEAAKAEGDAKVMAFAYAKLEGTRKLLQEFAVDAARYIHALPKPKAEEEAPGMVTVNPRAHLLDEIGRRFSAFLKEQT